MCLNFVLACAQINGYFLKCERKIFSAVLSTPQTCLAELPFAELTSFSNAINAALLSSGPPFGRRARNGGTAPVPTSHWLSKSFALGYARSRHTVIIFAHVSPKPRAFCNSIEISSIFWAGFFLASFITGKANSATSKSLRDRFVILLTRFSSSSFRILSGMIRKQLVISGFPVRFRYESIAFSIGPPGSNAFAGSFQNDFCNIRGN
mmetsp:Transcript_17771/g.28944  ORF Transcript_17771/g.28944 Transcript_17771/m.28944 type:complete len:207 (-) Transcript_17771:743-1363(-)